ncbi:MAG: hypothetical protein AB8G22_05885 [Saprospiraceae bacterium]
MNNFQRLMEEEERNAPQPPPLVQNNVAGTLGMFRFIGQIVEMYLPQFSNMLLNMVGGSESEMPQPTDTERRIMPHDEPLGHRRRPSNPNSDNPIKR